MARKIITAYISIMQFCPPDQLDASVNQLIETAEQR